MKIARVSILGLVAVCILIGVIGIGKFFRVHQTNIGIPESPSSKLLTLQVVSGDFPPGNLIPLSLAYYGTPLPEKFYEKFLSQLTPGVRIEAHGVEYKRGAENWKKPKHVIGTLVTDKKLFTNMKSGVAVDIGNSSDWEKKIRIIPDDTL